MRVRPQTTLGLETYEWEVNLLSDDFVGTTIDTSKWIVSSGVAQDEKVVVTGNNYWGTRYMFSQDTFSEQEGLTFYARVRPVNTTGNQYGMFGFKNISTNYHFNQMPYAVYFMNGEIRVYEGGSNRGMVTGYTRNDEYEIKIALKSTGANYYFRKAGQSFWNLVYNSSYSALTELKAGMTIQSGTFEVDDAKVSLELQSISPTLYVRQGTYPVDLTVTDASGQQDSDRTVIHALPNEPPVANPGGPYLAGETDAVAGDWLIAFDGSASSDDFGILTYEWDFDDSDGIQVDSTEILPIHFYNAPGTYRVTLTVTDHALQTHSMTTTVNIDLSGTDPPTADPDGPYTVNEESAKAGLWTVVFDGSGSSDNEGIARYVWDFGDGNTLTTSYEKDRHNFFEAGTRLYGFDVKDANLRIIGTQDNTRVRIVNLKTGYVTYSGTINTYEQWNDVGPGNGIYFKVEADKPVLAYETDGSAHSAFVPSLDAGPVGHEFIFYYHSGNGFYVFAMEDTVIRAFDTSNSIVAEHSMPGGSYWNPGLGNGIYRFMSTGRIAMQTVGGTGYTTVPTIEGGGAGRAFYCATHAGTTGALAVFAYEDAEISMRDMDSGDIIYSPTINQGSYWWQTGVGTRRLSIESTGDVEVWAGDAKDVTVDIEITDLGDDISFAGGRNGGREFYAHGLTDGLVILSPFDGTVVNIDGIEEIMNADDYLHLDGGALYHITSNNPVVVQTLGRASQYSDLGTYLGGVSEVLHKYDNAGTYTLTLTTYDHSNQSDSSTTTVNVESSDPPNAHAGGPYKFGEESARQGKYVITFDGTGSFDDFGIYQYKWDFGDVYTEDFAGTVIDEKRWIAGSNVVQNEMLTLTATHTVRDQGYCFSQKNFKREGGNVFTARVRWRSTYVHLSWGLKNNSTDYDYSHMSYAIRMQNGQFGIYEDGNSPANNLANFSRNQWYDLKIELKPVQGARYFFKPANQTEWTLLYDSNHATRATLFKVGSTASFGTIDMDDIRVETSGLGANATHVYDVPGVYPVSLIVSDHALQTDTDSTSLTITSGDPPTANAGGPYSGEPFSHIRFDGTRSTDDNAIARYVWDFGDGCTGEGAGASHFYKAEGTYTVTLTVYDNLIQSDTDETTVSIATGTAPIAEAGGPYLGGAGAMAFT